MYIEKNEFSERVIRECAETYCGIWKEPPWCEDFWVPEEVELDIVKQLSKKGSQSVMFLNGSGVDGFTWGYEVTHSEMEEISGGACFPNDLFIKPAFYIDELAVVKEKRGHGIGEELTRHLIRIAKNAGIRTLFLRTDKSAIPARKIYTHLGFLELEVYDRNHPTRNYWVIHI